MSIQVSHLSIAMIASVLALYGCTKKLTPDVEIKTIDYYINHVDEARKVADECSIFQSGALSAMTNAEQKIVSESAYMTNCSNAGQGIYGAYQKRLREAASKY